MYKLLSPESIGLSLRDFFNIKYPIRSHEEHSRGALEWLKNAQDRGRDGGVSSWYSLASGWAPSYIETTGYIINTFLDCAIYFKDVDLKKRAIVMADFLLNMQLPSGGFRTEVPEVKIDSLPTTFDTGQDLIGLTEIYKQTGRRKYLDSATRGADFLCNIQEKDGSWLRFAYGGIPHTYETRTAWSLLKVYEITKKPIYKKHALRNLEWALKNQKNNGWFSHNDIPDMNSRTQYTHIISYAIEGLLFSGIILNNKEYIKVAKKSADALLGIYYNESFLAGEYNDKWESEVNYTCLTGNAQISLVWLNLYLLTRDKKYLLMANRMNNFLKSQQDISSQNRNVKGGLKGSFPLYGDILRMKGYCRMAYLNWATKFFIDALLLEDIIGKEK